MTHIISNIPYWIYNIKTNINANFEGKRFRYRKVITMNQTNTITHPIPAQAAKAGYTSLVFYDDFDDLSTFDIEGTGQPGYLWYLDRPFGWSPVSADGYFLRDSVLTIRTPDHCAGWGPCTYSVRGQTGHVFRYGYFEARLRFSHAPTEKTTYFPAWWSFSVEHASGRNDDHWSELDFFEAMPNSEGRYDGAFVCTVHDWIRSKNGEVLNYQNPNNWHPNRVLDDEWHVYACLWKPGLIEWYMDGVLIAFQRYGADRHPDPSPEKNTFVGCYSFMDQEDMLLILGTSHDWPLEVDWVRVWQE